jgi:hypothetical protein
MPENQRVVLVDDSADIIPLQRLAATAVSISRRVPRWHPDDSEDSFQTAYVAGLSAVRSAQRRNARPTQPMILRAMRRAVGRQLCRKRARRFADKLGRFYSDRQH